MDIKKLRQQRGHEQNKVTIVAKFAESTEIPGSEISLEALLVQLERLDSANKNYHEIQHRIYETLPEGDIPKEDLQHEEDFENKYLNAKIKLLRLKREIDHEHDVNRSALQANNIHDNTTLHRLLEQQALILEGLANRPASTPLERSSFTPSHEVKLPKLEVPTFTGKYEDWSSFSDIFTITIHNCPSLSEVQKLQYLKGLLRGEAAGLLKHITITAANYIPAWTKLVERYDKRNQIVSAYIKRFIEQQAITQPSSATLRRLYNTSDEVIRALTSLEAEERDPWLLHIITNKLDTDTLQLWSRETANLEKITFYDLLTFLNKRCDALETSEGPNKRLPTSSHPNISSKDRSKGSATRISSFVTSLSDCKMKCQDSHALYKCSKFLKLHPSERLQRVKDFKACINCLQSTHVLKGCKYGNCRICSKRHNTLLCTSNSRNSKEGTDISASSGEPANASMASSTPVNSLTSSVRSLNHVLLSTAIIEVEDASGKGVTCRALLDSASQANFVTESLLKRLALRTIATPRPISGISQMRTRVTQGVSLTIRSRHSDYRCDIDSLVIQTIASEVPNTRFDIRNWQIPTTIRLADPLFYIPEKIDILLGAELFYKLLQPQQISIGTDLPILQNTRFGWLVCGGFRDSTDSHSIDSATTQCMISTIDTLHSQMSKFWELEDCANVENKLSTEEEACEFHFKTTTKRDSTGKFIVKLPFVNDKVELEESKSFALKRFYHLEKKFRTDSELRQTYSRFFEEYIQLGHMSLTVDQSQTSSILPVYLPHHAVWKQSSSTTKLRVVFDGSARTSTGVSINDILLVGKPCQQLLFNILLGFRKGLSDNGGCGKDV